MSSWNHRVLAFNYPKEIIFQICEVYYDKDGNPNGYTEKGDVVGNSWSDLEWVLKKMRECLEKPILCAGDKFPQEYKQN